MFGTPGMDEEEIDDYPQAVEDDEDEREDAEIRATDNILIAGKIEAEFAAIEVYIFEEKT